MAFFPPTIRLTAARAKEIILLLQQTAEALETPTDKPMVRGTASLRPAKDEPVVAQQAPVAAKDAKVAARVRAVVKPETLTAPPAPRCPKCSGPMRQRTRKSDGQMFWGCAAFPDCTGTRDSYVARARRNAGADAYDDDDERDM